MSLMERLDEIIKHKDSDAQETLELLKKLTGEVICGHVGLHSEAGSSPRRDPPRPGLERNRVPCKCQPGR